jgi:hypothetical protein
LKSYVAILSLLTVFTAFADSVNFLRAEAEMTVVSSKYGFKNIEQVNLKIYEDENQDPVSVVLTWDEANEEGEIIEVVTELLVKTVTEDLGHKTLYATLANEAPFDPKTGGPMGARFSLSLEDFSESVTADAKEYLWRASVNRGFGWCGTMDDRMELVGNPTFDGNPLYRN